MTDEVEYLSAIAEENHVIAQANAKVGADGNFEVDVIQCRQNGDFIMAAPEQIDYMDVSRSEEHTSELQSR